MMAIFADSRSFPLISTHLSRAGSGVAGLNGVRERRFGGVISVFGGQMGGFGGAMFTVFGSGHWMARGLSGGLEFGVSVNYGMDRRRVGTRGKCQWPRANRSAKTSGKPASRILRCAVAMSYSTRRCSNVPASPTSLS